MQKAVLILVLVAVVLFTFGLWCCLCVAHEADERMDKMMEDFERNFKELDHDEYE